MWRKLVNHRPTRISQAQQLCNFVEGFPSCIVSRVADIFVRPVWAVLFCKIKMRVSA